MESGIYLHCSSDEELIRQAKDKGIPESDIQLALDCIHQLREGDEHSAWSEDTGFKTKN